jgi:hypothetical protein
MRLTTLVISGVLFAGIVGCSSPEAHRPTDAGVDEKVPPRDRVAEAESEAEKELHAGIIRLKPPRKSFAELRAVVSPYGTWTTVPVYGEVWKPRAELVGSGWTPFTQGRWMYTECGWTWVSAFSDWGWAPFHFGRFALTPTDGWVWVPDVSWSPSPVAWREGDASIGWAPLPPGFAVSEDVNHGQTPRIQREAWVFVAKKDFLAVNVAKKVRDPKHQDTLLLYTSRIRQWRQLKGQYIYVGPHRQSLADRLGTYVPGYLLATLQDGYGTKILPEDYTPMPGTIRKNPFSEVRPDVDQVTTVVGPNSPKRLPPRRITRVYREEAGASPPDKPSSSKTKTPTPPSRPPVRSSPEKK